MSRAFRLGVFIVFTFVAFSIGVFLIGDKEFLFSSTYRLNARFNTVTGLNNGAEVRVGGVRKGTVTEILLPSKPEDGVSVAMKMESSTRRVLKDDSMAAIQTEGLLGSKYIEVSFGSESAAPLKDGATIRSVPPLDIADLMKKTDAILDTTKATMLNVQQSSGDFKDITAKINAGQGTMGALVNDRQMYNQINSATAQANLGATAFHENMEALKTNFFLRGFFNRRGYDDSAKLTEYEVSTLPKTPEVMRFTFDGKKIFTSTRSAKLRSQKTLNDAGRFLESNPFSLAVAVAYTGMTGDSAEARELTQARAMVVREYLVNNFKMNDTRFRTMGLGKQENRDAGENGKVEILVYSR
jgi:phospholipid/cholesterol/gamma-HCH transport system substrate-binding protein